MSTQNAKLEVISIDKIELGNTNPRKSFDPKALKELAESIKEHGILQPILVRPYVDEKSNWQDYQLVCGERRYRAALQAGLEEIPCNVRVLTDEEAFELQIIENLERKDVHPLDEADAFKQMLDSGKYTILDIAVKMAKSESFIAQRLKLVDLIDEVRADFLAGHLGIGHAILIARCDAIKQMDIYEEAKPWGGEDPDYGTISELKGTIENDSYLISDAKFDTEDTELVKGCGACSVCLKRSGVNPVLFEDMAEDRCFDEKCFDAKEEAFIIKEVGKIINNGDNVVLVNGWGHPDEMIYQMCEQFKVRLYERYEWRLSKDDEPYENEVETPFNAFCVNGEFKGTYANVYLKKVCFQEAPKENALPSPTSGKPQSNEELELRAEFAKIEQRQKRALELDDEKVWEGIRNIDTSAIKSNVSDLLISERNALCFAMMEKLGYYSKRELYDLLDKEFDVEFAQEKVFSEEDYNRIVRAFILDVLPNSFGTAKSCPDHVAYEAVINYYFQAQVDTIKNEQEIIADKRIANAEKKKSDILAKLEKLVPVEEIETKAEEVLPSEDKPFKQPFKNEVKTFEKVSKKYALNNSYFKNTPPTYPRNPLEVAMYAEQHNELPFNMELESNPNWLYYTYIEYQKRNNVYHSQFFTPPATAIRMAEISESNFTKDPYVLDACCGFGMLSKEVREKGYIVKGFDFSADMVDLFNFTIDGIAEQLNYEEDSIEQCYDNIIANPPYELPKLTKFLEVIYDVLTEKGVAVLLIPKGFIDKDKPKALVSILDKYIVLDREDMSEDFGHTKVKAEIVVLNKK
ncbi:ParB/RepB/Spo0J family partition protein [Flavobacterium sp.]|uniref:ParB/RepB/Spo0J family partition protein n=1 Tax=Flavobacterium sp. TaxID=239 RepID=UPI00261E1B77|nr:ParB/RepB/Spo0J family partition protein [Flavobacterium sp.]